MKLTNRLKISILTLALAAFGFACSDSSSGDNASGQYTINGSVEGDESAKQAKVANVEGAVVTAARVTSSGSFETIDGAETETDASGNFQLNVNADAAENIVVIAESEGKEWKGFVSSEIKSGNSVNLKPIDTESNAEAEVFAEVVSSGSADMVQKADIEAAVSSQAAATIESSSSAASTVAAGLENSAEARAEFYAETMGDNSEDALNQTYEMMADAQVQLEAELESASTTEQENEAYEVFFESAVNSFVSAGLSEDEAAKGIDIWGRVLVNSTTTASSDIENSARANASYMTAIAIDKAVRAEAEASSMSESSVQAIADAGLTLKSEVWTSAGADADISAAFQAYHEEVKSTMENDGSISATLVVAVDTEINASGGYKSSFESTLSGLLDASAVVDAYTQFNSSIQTEVESNSTDMNEAEIESVTELMLLINLAS